MSNTYHIEAAYMSRRRFLVEADSEDEAFEQVRYGDVDYEEDFDGEYDDMEVTEVEYGEQYGTAGVVVEFSYKGIPDEDAVVSHVNTMLQGFEGRVEYVGDDGSIEITFMNINNVNVGA